MVHNHTDVRVKITITDEASGLKYPNNTITGTDLSSPAQFKTGDNVHYGDETGIREIQYMITGKENDGKEKVLNFKGIRCIICTE